MGVLKNEYSEEMSLGETGDVDDEEDDDDDEVDEDDDDDVCCIDCDNNADGTAVAGVLFVVVVGAMGEYDLVATLIGDNRDEGERGGNAGTGTDDAAAGVFVDCIIDADRAGGGGEGGCGCDDGRWDKLWSERGWLLLLLSLW